MIERKINDNLRKAIELIVEKIPKDVKWCFMTGVAAFFYGNDREPIDIDIMVSDSDMQKLADSLISFILKRPEIVEKDIFKMMLAKFEINKYDVEAASDITISIEGKEYVQKIDEEMVKRIKKIKIGSIEIPLMPPEDIIVFKAICQRGAEKGKHDVEDMKSIFKNQQLDWEYLEERSKMIKGYNRIFDIIQKLGYVNPEEE